jgi:hypothetical protein
MAMAHIYILIAAVVIVGWVVVYIASQRVLTRTCAELRREFQRQIDALSTNVRAAERSAGAETAAVPAQATSAAEEITPEILRTITETITALLGRKVRIRSVKILQTANPMVSSWAQQGRVVVQASHNLAQRGHEV